MNTSSHHKSKNVVAEKYQVGDGVTIMMYSDQKACTVIDVDKPGRKIVVQRDHAIRLTKPEFIPGGFAGHCTNNRQIEYEYERDPTGEIFVFTKRISYRDFSGFITRKEYNPERITHCFVESWCAMGSRTGEGSSLRPGRHEFYDYNF